MSRDPTVDGTELTVMWLEDLLLSSMLQHPSGRGAGAATSSAEVVTCRALGPRRLLLSSGRR